MGETLIIKKTLNNLLRGLLHGNGDTIYRSHRKLFEIGSLALPEIEKHLMSYQWNRTKFDLEIIVLSGLLALINDIDEKRANEVGRKIREVGCSKIVDARIESILKFTLDDFEIFEVKGIKIYQSKKLKGTKKIKTKIGCWLSSVPVNHLEQIERLYIIPIQDVEYRGTYIPILCSIMIEWDIKTSWFNPLSYFFLIRIEKTLYHEIGHHVCKHAFNQDPEYEKEADSYAKTMVLKNHTVLRRIIKVIRFFFAKPSLNNEE